MKKRPRRWTLEKVLERDRNAATVFVTVLAMANGRRQLNVTRGRIRAFCGLSERRIGTAVDALHTAGWILRRYGRRDDSTWYRLYLPNIDISPVCRKTTYRKQNYDISPVCRKTTYRGRQRVSENDTQGRVPCMSENDILSPIGDKAGPTAPGPDPCGVSPGADRPELREGKYEQLEREKLEAIRAARLAQEATT